MKGIRPFKFSESIFIVSLFIALALLFSIVFSDDYVPYYHTLSPLKLVVYVSLFAIGEELFIRRFLQFHLYTYLKIVFGITNVHLNSILSIIIPSLIFFYLHHNAPEYILILSFYLGIVYHIYRNVYLNIFIHLLSNLFFAFLLILYA